MDRRVKERLIGASILVALAVLVVPELLSGPKPLAPVAATLPATAPEPTRIVTLDLATSKAPAGENETGGTQGSTALSAPEPSNSATPNTSAGQSSTGAASAGQLSTGVPSTGAPRAGPASAGQSITGASSGASQASAPVETAAPSPTSSRTAWAVQLGSFASRANADNLSRQLKGQGFSVYVLPGGGSGAQARYRVRVGPLADRGAAERMAAKLKSTGHVSSLVGPAG
jgi:DedD protein